MTTHAHGLDWVLLGRGDEYILKENSYAVIFSDHDSLLPTDAWLDIGANFGVFSVRAANRVARVVAVEPFPENRDHLQANVEANHLRNVTILEAAIVGGPSGITNLAIGKTFDYTHRVGYVRGRQNLAIHGININEVIDKYGINKIKMDCEGSEEEIIHAANFLGIEELILEWHFTLIPDPDWTKMFTCIKILEDAGFKMLKAPTGPPTKRWTAILWARKR